ncbi:MAG: tripartite tricarboxylate transporter permease, partial [Actinobacteria bacterium]|nr:tripartite tricarboxylate transporter permease [Actinomycetota bacterium]
VRMLKVPYKILMPLIITISAVGVFATDNNVADVWVMVIFVVLVLLLAWAQRAIENKWRVAR